GLLSISSFAMGGLAILGNFVLWIAYLFFALLPDMLRSQGARRFADNVVNAADPGRGYCQKKRQVEQLGSADPKRALAEALIRRGGVGDAVELYESARTVHLGGQDPILIKGLERAKMLPGDGPAAEQLFLQLKQPDPAAADADAELDYARALE